MIINTNNNRNCSKLQSDKLSWAFGLGELKSKQENSGNIKFLGFFFMSINGYQVIRTGHDKADLAPVLQPKPALCYIIITTKKTWNNLFDADAEGEEHALLSW